MEIRFIDDFKKLKGMGYIFCKVWAHKYICYRTNFTIKDNGHDRNIWIWKKGKDVWVQDLYNDSYLALQFFLEKGWDYEGPFGAHFTLDSTTNEYLGPTIKEHWWDSKYRVIKIFPSVKEKLKELYDLGMIKIE